MISSVKLTSVAIAVGMLPAQSNANPPVISNQKDAVWTPESGTPGADVFAPHWHSANERIILIEGTTSIRAGDLHKELQPGGYAFLPAKQVQTMSCGSASRCGFYVYWDAKLDNHKASDK
jgi:hypothetical protein